VIYLGKWPTLRVVGQPVSQWQASRILLSTYPWWGFANDKGWLRQVREIAAEFGMPVEPLRSDFKTHDEYCTEQFRVFMPAFQEFCEQNGIICWMSADGIGNDMITGNYRSWCDWNGLIAGQFNIGKWVDEDEVLTTWKRIAELHPALTLTADLVSEQPDQQGGSDAVEYTRAYRYHVARGTVSMQDYEDLEPLVLPQAYINRVMTVDRMDEQGVSPERLRQAFRDLLD
jgi:hypothetical protein